MIRPCVSDPRRSPSFPSPVGVGLGDEMTSSGQVDSRLGAQRHLQRSGFHERLRGVHVGILAGSVWLGVCARDRACSLGSAKQTDEPGSHVISQVVKGIEMAQVLTPTALFTTFFSPWKNQFFSLPGLRRSSPPAFAAPHGRTAADWTRADPSQPQDRRLPLGTSNNNRIPVALPKNCARAQFFGSAMAF